MINLQLARKVFEVEAQSILALKERLGPEFEMAVRLLGECQGKVIVTGIGKSGQIGRKIASTLSSTGTPAVFLHPAESGHGDLGMMGDRDVVLAISYGGETPELSPVLTASARRNLPVIAITGNRDSELARLSRTLLDVKVSREACPLGLAPTASSTATLAMGDALAMCVCELRGFQAEDFALNHPGGVLGFKLSRLKDLMHTGSALPLLSTDAPMKRVLSMMSQGEVRGVVGVVDVEGNLIGIITDGDIRRKLESDENPLRETAGTLMKSSPRTIDAGELAEKALFLMEEFKINLLFVLDKQSAQPRKPVGVVHVQDLIAEARTAKRR
ncbi:MAG: KpsF/GutQ family sugar-phosphate isomerase [Bdellovibrio sp.]